MRSPFPQESNKAGVRVRAGWLACNVLTALAATVLVTTPLAAQATPDFSGTWKMNVAESKADTPGPKQLVVKIEHKEPDFKYEVTGQDPEGAEFQQGAAFKTDGKEYPGAGSLTISAHWEGRVLLARIGSGDATKMTVALRLADDGKRMTRDVVLKDTNGEHKIREVYDKQ